MGRDKNKKFSNGYLRRRKMYKYEIIHKCPKCGYVSYIPTNYEEDKDMDYECPECFDVDFSSVIMKFIGIRGIE